MKLIMRADDYGYTVAHNLGTIEAIDSGVITSVDLMLDTPGTEDGIERIKQFPWISVGWHAHFWGSPVTDQKLVPSMIDETGRFKFRNNPDLKHTVAFEEALIECRAQVEKCIRLLGKSPDTTWIQDDSPVERARRQVCDEYGIVYGFAKKVDRKTRQEMQPSEKYKHLNIYMPTQHDSVYKILYSDFAEARAAYDPVKYFVEDPDHLLEKEICITAWHPGYLDSFVYKDSSKHFNLARPMDIAALCSEELKQWIKDNKVQLVNHRDALFGTREYQNHLKAVNSDLAV